VSPTPVIEDAQRILLVRRDNIGDLVCTTPLLSALRARFPNAHLAALTSSYTAPVLAHNPDIDSLYAYTKLKHRPPEQGFLAWLWRDRLSLRRRLRRAQFDLVVLASPEFSASAARFARATAALRVLGVTPDGEPRRDIDLVAQVPESAQHEVERVFSLGRAIGIEGTPPALRLVPALSAIAQLRSRMRSALQNRPIGIHISARKISQRWPCARFAELLRALRNAGQRQFFLFWSPGAEDNPLHPGDDAMAQQLLASLGEFPLVPVRTESLETLIAGLSLCDKLICSDGGAMHLAAALGKPVVCLFGDSDAARWHPWGVPYELLQKDSREAADIGVDEVVNAWSRLQRRVEGPDD
jgi:ADP-heptose:LPS heptosyltransferase